MTLNDLLLFLRVRTRRRARAAIDHALELAEQYQLAAAGLTVIQPPNERSLRLLYLQRARAERRLARRIARVFSIGIERGKQ